MSKLLVVGGTGFIGYHVIKEAIRRKWKVTSVSLNKPKQIRRLRNVNYIQVNTINLNKLKKKLKFNFDFIVNAGGYGKHPGFNKSGKKLFDTHYRGLINLVKIFSKKKIKKFIQLGSSAEYGNASGPQNEKSKCFPKTPYALAKLSCTNFLQNLSKIKDFPCTILRLFLVYGPNQDQNRILPQVIKNCLHDKKFPITKGEQYCDFCYIDDVVNAIFKSLNSQKSNGEIINVGLGKPKKIKNVVKLVQKTIGKGTPQFGKLKYRPETNMKLYPNIKKQKKL